MLGIPDPMVWMAYLLCLLSAGACVAYGLLNWNQGAENEAQECEEESRWEAKEKKLEENL